MFRILIVEDIRDTLELLRNLLEKIFLNVQVETASTVEEGQKKISDAAANRQPFDIAILDFKLPAQKGLNPEIDESLCQEIKSRMPETMVIHFTAFHEDSAVNKHIAQHHQGRNAPRVELIQKSNDWPENLLREIKAYLIERQIHDLFEKQPETIDARKASSKTSGSLTHKLAALSRDIIAYWHDLDDVTKSRIREHFETNEDQEQVRISLRLRK